MGMALMGTGMASGAGAAVEAARMAISSPLLEEVSIHGARGVLINVTGGPNLTLHDAHEAVSLIQKEAESDANIIFGTVVNEELGDEVRITVIATGFAEEDGVAEETAQESVASPKDQLKNRVVENKNVIKKDNYDLPITVRNKYQKQSSQPPVESEDSYVKKAPQDNSNFSDLRQHQYKIMTPNGPIVFEDDDYDIPAFLRNQAD